MLLGGTRTISTIYNMCPGLDVYRADPAQPLTTASEELDDLDHDLCEVWMCILPYYSMCAYSSLWNCASSLALKLSPNLLFVYEPV